MDETHEAPSGDAAAPATTDRTVGAPARRPLPWGQVGRRLLRWLGVAVVVLAGGFVGTALTPATQTEVGPLTLDVRVEPSLDPGVRLLLPPVGEVTFDTHLAPVVVQGRVAEVDVEAAQALLNDPRGLAGLGAAAPDTLRSATLRAATATGLFALGGALALSLLVFRTTWWRTAHVAAGLVGVLLATTAMTVVTFEPDRLAQPRFTGLLSRAPYVATQAGGLIERLESYRSGLEDIVRGVTALYAASGALPVVPSTVGGDVTTVLHVSDVHLNPLAYDLVDRLVEQFDVDVVVDTGDVTTWGTEVESATLSRIGAVGVPYVFVRGNHDSRRTEVAVAANRNAVVLDDDVREVGGLVFAGIGDPTFTPDEGQELAAVTPDGEAGPTTLVAPQESLDAADPTDAGTGTPPGEAAPPDPQVIAGEALARTLRERVTDGERPVDVALVHQPRASGPLSGLVPLVLAGHLHNRSVSVDEAGTRLMVEGSTGGAGITAGTVDRLAEGEPVPLSATLLYFTRADGEPPRLVAYDEVTVGGFGLASVALQRVVLRADEVPAGPTPTPSPSSPGASPEESATGSPSSAPAGSPGRTPGTASTGAAGPYGSRRPGGFTSLA